MNIIPLKKVILWLPRSNRNQLWRNNPQLLPNKILFKIKRKIKIIKPKNQENLQEETPSIIDKKNPLPTVPPISEDLKEKTLLF